MTLAVGLRLSRCMALFLADVVGINGVRAATRRDFHLLVALTLSRVLLLFAKHLFSPHATISSTCILTRSHRGRRSLRVALVIFARGSSHTAAKTILGIIMGRYNEILRQIDDDSSADRDGALIATDWAESFLQ